jgi:acetyltransferase-like isoleucine patch superfamily enzyme
MLLNDKHPRAINPDGSPKSDADWTVSEGVIGHGAAIGGGAVVLPGVNVGRWALVGAGSVVTRDVAERAIVAGNPAQRLGFACDCGHPLSRGEEGMACPSCGRRYEIPADDK